jgi:hypothetical protein
MTISLTSPVVGQFNPDTRDIASTARKVALAVFGAGTAAQRQTARAELLGRPDFVCTAKTTAAEFGQAIDLTDEGVTFAASTVRKIRWRVKSRNGTERWIAEYEQYVAGATTPILLGSPLMVNCVADLNGTSSQYGNCHAVANFDSSDTAITTVLGTSDTTGSTAGSSIGNISTNTATLTHPRARQNSTTNTVKRRVQGVNASADVATATETLHAGVFPVDGTTMSIFTADTATPSADGFDDDGRLEVSFYLEPPPRCALVMNSNNVELHIGYDATDNVYHDIEVFIGKAESFVVAVD